MKPIQQLFAATDISPGDLPKAPTNSAQLENVLSIVLGIVGALAVLMIVVAGLRYITSAGDPEKAGRAKNGIILALVGLLLAIVAQAIVVFVVKRI